MKTACTSPVQLTAKSYQFFQKFLGRKLLTCSDISFLMFLEHSVAQMWLGANYELHHLGLFADQVGLGSKLHEFLQQDFQALVRPEGHTLMILISPFLQPVCKSGCSVTNSTVVNEVIVPNLVMQHAILVPCHSSSRLEQLPGKMRSCLQRMRCQLSLTLFQRLWQKRRKKYQLSSCVNGCSFSPLGPLPSAIKSKQPSGSTWFHDE